MLQSIEIENFQSHIDSTLELHPNVNLIVGESDNGKSAILRAIYWCAMNQPSGNNFINWNNKKNIASVTLINDHHTIIRSMGKSINAYFIDDFDDELTGFGRSVPEVINQALRLNELNFQRQKDVFFLFDKSAPEVGRYLNTVIDLDIIDSSLSHSNTRVKRIDNEISHQEKIIEEKSNKLSKYKPLSKIDKLLKKMEKLETEIHESKKLQQVLNKLIDSIEHNKKEIKLFKKIANLKESVEELSDINQEIIEGINKANALEMILHNIDKTKLIVDKTFKIINIKNQVDHLESINKAVNRYTAAWSELEKLISQYTIAKDEMDVYKTNINTYKTKYKRLMPDICPFCNHEINKEEHECLMN